MSFISTKSFLPSLRHSLLLVVNYLKYSGEITHDKSNRKSGNRDSFIAGELTDEDFDKIFSVNARGAMYMLQAAANRVKDGGRIVQFSTGGTMMPIPAGGIYAASKAAGERFAFALAKEIGHRQVTVNVVSPVVTNTDGLIMPQEAIDRLIEQTPLGRLGQPDDGSIAELS